MNIRAVMEASDAPRVEAVTAMLDDAHAALPLRMFVDLAMDVARIVEPPRRRSGRDVDAERGMPGLEAYRARIWALVNVPAPLEPRDRARVIEHLDELASRPRGASIGARDAA